MHNNHRPRQPWRPSPQVLTSARGVVQPDTAAATGAATQGLAALSISARQQQPAASSGPGSAGAAGAAGAGPSLQTAAGESRAERDAAAGSSGAAAATTAGALSTPPSRARAAGAKDGSLVWLSNAEQPAGPQPGQPERKENRDERQGMVACG